MKGFILSILFCCFTISFTQAQSSKKTDEVILNTDEIYTGEVVFQNEQVVVIQTLEGNKFQFQIADVKLIRKDSNIVHSAMPDEIIEESKLKKILLKTGESYVGEIIRQDEKMVIIKIEDGKRFQFQLGDVSSISSYSSTDAEQADEIENTNFAMLIDLSGGASYAKQAYGWAPTMQAALVLGGKDIIMPNTFLGVGVGYNVIFPVTYNKGESISFLPVFVRLHADLNSNKTSPFLEVDAGYSLALTPDFGGGTNLKVTAGITRKINDRTSLYVGAYAGIQSFSGDLIQIYNSHKYIYYGKTSAQSLGAKIALRF